MLDSLHIQNYRLFKELKIEKLGQVNLIAGKNNCGKTALLEAIRIWASDGDGSVVNNIVFRRGDWKVNRELSMYSKFFLNQNYGDASPLGTSIPFIINDLSGKLITLARPLYGLAFDLPKNRWVLGHSEVTSGISYENPRDTLSVINISIEIDNLLSFWKEMSLTPAEDDVLTIMKILLPNIKRVAVEDGQAKILLKTEEYPNSLKNYGDGANRLFCLALAIVKAKFSSKKMLLIDEFEVGLHHSIQTKLWEIIFKYAKEWNIQVFVTTHSMDTVRSFAVVSDKYEGMGEYMRLQKSRMTGEVEAIVYSSKSLDYAIEDSLEMR
jgi:predicted ATPase